MEHESPSKKKNGKTGLPFQTFRCSRKFSTGTTRKVVYHLLFNRNFRNLLVNGKRPVWFLAAISLLYFYVIMREIVSYNDIHVDSCTIGCTCGYRKNKQKRIKRNKQNWQSVNNFFKTYQLHIPLRCPDQQTGKWAKKPRTDSSHKPWYLVPAKTTQRKRRSALIFSLAESVMETFRWFQVLSLWMKS